MAIRAPCVRGAVVPCTAPINTVVVAGCRTLWINLIVIASQSANWFIEQGLVEGSFRHDPGRWLISLGAGLGIVIPLGLLSRLKQPIYRQLFKSLALAGMVVVLLVPTRLLEIPNSQGVAIIQLIGLTAFNLILSRRLRQAENYSDINDWSKNWFSLFSALCIVGLLGVPWAWIGALGSWMDTVLGLMVGLSAGASVFGRA